MATEIPTITEAQADAALARVALWLGPQMGYGDEPAPTGREAMYQARGPMLRMDFDFSSDPVPAVILDGGPHDWAVEVSMDIGFCDEMAKIGVFAEPYSGWALCLYPFPS